MKKVALFGGSFNPVHTGHLVIASLLRQQHGFDEVWFVLSPQNPLKENTTELLDDDIRLDMLHLAVDPVEHFEVCDIEMFLPRPSYTVNTLKALTGHHPDVEFTWIAGGDNYASFSRWKEPDKILEMARLLVYPRPGSDIVPPADPRISIADTPMLDISSTRIRRMIADGMDVNFLVPEIVNKYINKHHLYR